MLFNSFEFICVLLPITMALFFLLGQIGLHNEATAFLVVASLFFYSWWNPAYLLLIVVSIGFNYILGRYISNLSASSASSKKRLYLFGGVAVNLAVLGYFKYFSFLLSSLSSLFNFQVETPEILLPLAISFFTFQQISYLIDASRNETKSYSFIDYALFVTFFPQLIAGPIVHHKEMMPQFRNPTISKFSSEQFAIGLTIFCAGLFKKVVIADNISPVANTIFGAALEGDSLTLCQAWLGALAYSFQLYFDFSGYSEMALGIARMFGIILPLNFNSPYKAVSISDFWRRWHITLSNFLRDYLYIPLGGNRRGQVRQVINLIVTMLLGGLWHGAGWTFVIWGGLHGLFLSVNHVWRVLIRKGEKGSEKEVSSLRTLCAQAITFGLVVFAWVMFRAEDLDSALSMWKSMAGLNGFSMRLHGVDGVGLRQLLHVIGACLWVWVLPNVQEIMHLYKPTLQSSKKGMKSSWLKWKPSFGTGIVMSVVIFVIVKSTLSAPASEFLYFNF